MYNERHDLAVQAYADLCGHPVTGCPAPAMIPQYDVNGAMIGYRLQYSNAIELRMAQIENRMLARENEMLKKENETLKV